MTVEALAQLEWLTVPATARRLGISNDTVRRMVKAGQFVSRTQPGSRRIQVTKSSVDAVLASSFKGGGPA